MRVATMLVQRSGPLTTKLPIGCIKSEQVIVQAVSAQYLEGIVVPLISLLAFWRSHGPVHPHQMESLEMVWAQGEFWRVQPILFE